MNSKSILRIYVDMDDTLCKYSEAKNKALQACPEMIYPQSQHGFYMWLEMMEDAFTAMSYLMKSDKCEIWIATAPSVNNPMSYTEKRCWVGRNLGEQFADRLIIIPDKSLLKGDILIDDLIAGRGQEDFEGEVWQFGSAEYPDWKSILNSLIKYKL
ncbi:5' nucleotidase, NT5C type [Vibrio harveyi]|uniref:5' nucleotidase, NT5C type n=1 Tax=Vibrio harveyi TaxID=669 RepID=UPI003CF68573